MSEEVEVQGNVVLTCESAEMREMVKLLSLMTQRPQFTNEEANERYAEILRALFDTSGDEAFVVGLVHCASALGQLALAAGCPSERLRGYFQLALDTAHQMHEAADPSAKS